MQILSINTFFMLPIIDYIYIIIAQNEVDNGQK